MQIIVSASFEQRATITQCKVLKLVILQNNNSKNNNNN